MSYIRSRYKQEYYTNIKNCSGDIASGLSYERKEIQMHHPRGQKVDPTVTLDSINPSESYSDTASIKGKVGFETYYS